MNSRNGRASYPDAANAGSKLGINLFAVNDWNDRQMTFVDVMKNARGFGAIDRCWDPVNYPVPLDSDGWPKTDFGVWFLTAVPDPLNRPLRSTYPSLFGTYNLIFTGQATVTSPGRCQIRNVNYDAATNITTAEVVVGPDDNSLSLGFTQTNNGVRDIRLLRPGYPRGTTQVFTDQFLDALKPFSTIRLMDFLRTNSSPVKSWSQRALPADIVQSGSAGVAWEYVIELANTSRKDIWINIPEGVDLTDRSPDNYVIRLARLLKAGLNPGIHVYVEYSNEVWYRNFQQAIDNLAAAVNEVDSGADSALNYDKVDDQACWQRRRIAHQTLKISRLFESVYGAAAINTAIRPVLMSDYFRPVIAEDSLRYIDDNFGPPNRHIYAIGGAPYIKLPNRYADVDGLYGSLQAGLNSVLQGFCKSASDDGTAPVASYKALADRYGLKSISYEGGPDFGFTETTPAIAAVHEQAVDDPRMGAVIHTCLAHWFGCGNDLFVYFNLAEGPGGYYGVYRDITIPTVKSATLNSIAATPLASFDGCAP